MKKFKFLSEKQNRYSLRKYKFGLASALIGSFIVFGGMNVHAQTEAPDSNSINTVNDAQNTDSSSNNVSDNLDSSAVNDAQNTDSSTSSVSDNLDRSAVNDNDTRAVSDNATSNPTVEEAPGRPEGDQVIVTRNDILSDNIRFSTYTDESKVGIPGVEYVNDAKNGVYAKVPSNSTISLYKKATTGEDQLIKTTNVSSETNKHDYQTIPIVDDNPDNHLSVGDTVYVIADHNGIQERSQEYTIPEEVDPSQKDHTDVLKYTVGYSYASSRTVSGLINTAPYSGIGGQWYMDLATFDKSGNLLTGPRIDLPQEGQNYTVTAPEGIDLNNQPNYSVRIYDENKYRMLLMTLYPVDDINPTSEQPEDIRIYKGQSIPTFNVSATTTNDQQLVFEAYQLPNGVTYKQLSKEPNRTTIEISGKPVDEGTTTVILQAKDELVKNNFGKLPYVQKQFNITVIAAHGQDQTIDKGTTPKADDSIGNKGDLPDGTTFEWKDTPDTTTPGDKPAIVIVRYPDGSQDEVPVVVQVIDYKNGDGVSSQLPSLTDAEVGDPIGQDQTIDKGTTPEAGDSIGNKGDLPDGTTFEWKDTPDTTTPGDKPAIVIVRYPDGSQEEVPVVVQVIDYKTGDGVSIQLPSLTDAEVGDPIGQDQTIDKGTTPEAGDSIGNKGDLPDGTTFEWKDTPDTTTPGDKPAVVIVHYPDGSQEEVPVVVRVIDDKNGDGVGSQLPPLTHAGLGDSTGHDQANDKGKASKSDERKELPSTGETAYPLFGVAALSIIASVGLVTVRNKKEG